MVLPGGPRMAGGAGIVSLGQLPRIPGDLNQSAWVAAVGDSITSASGSYPLQTPSGYLNWACLLSGGKLRNTRSIGAGGYTTAQILDLVPQVVALNPKPGYCVVLGGTNDAGNAVPLTTSAANLTAIYRTLRANSIIPVCCSIPPRTAAGATINAAIRTLNRWIEHHAMSNGYPFVDLYAVLVDPATGNYLAGYTSDNTHPLPVGYKVMGQAVSDRLSSLVAPAPIMLPTDNVNPIGYLTNPLMLTDTNADGTPDNWSRVSGAADCTFTLDNPASGDVVGKWMKIDKTANTAGSILRAGNYAVTAGDRLALCFRVKWVQGTNGQIHVGLFNASDFTTGGILNPLYTWTPNIDAATVYQENVIPSGVTSVSLQVMLNGGTGTAWIGQAQVLNLTTLGIG